MNQGQTGHPDSPAPGLRTTSDHDHPSSRYLRPVQSHGDAADAGRKFPAPLHDHCLAGFEEAATAALADTSITDELRAGLIEAARTRYGWEVWEVEAWLARHTS